jgi:formylglycine-generating enzyme required for sulfatase activity
VTAYWAAAYANYYGRRLPTSAEWLYAMKSDKDPAHITSAASPKQPAMSHIETIHIGIETLSIERRSLHERPFYVIHSKQNANGIRGLDENVNECCLLALEEPSKNY